MGGTRFRDRREAGRGLAVALESHGAHDPVILGLPRGGVPVAAEVARELGAPLDVLVVRKLGLPWQPEYAFGAVGEGGACVVDRNVCSAAALTDADVNDIIRRETREVDRRVSMFRGGHPMIDVHDREVIVVDDGMATGSTMLAAIDVVHTRGARKIVAAVPVASAGAARLVSAQVDELICLRTPDDFAAVGMHYEVFDQETDDHVRALLTGHGSVQLTIPASDALGRAITLPGTLTLPSQARGLIVFAHGSGSSRFSARNVHVAQILQRSGLATVLFDLLTEDEAADRRYVFDIDLLATRLLAALDHLTQQPQWANLPIGLFGASTGAGAALVAAARRPDQVNAVVSRGGRPDLAGPSLPLVHAPTLLIVGGLDHEVIGLNELAMTRLRCAHELRIVPGATHLFEESGTLDSAAAIACKWFLAHMPAHVVN